jgi:DNA-binding HxlR family transcriptional regulator
MPQLRTTAAAAVRSQPSTYLLMRYPLNGKHKSMAKRPLACGIGPAFEVVGGKWKAVILWELNTAVRRFGELRRLVPGISEKMLIQQLRELEADGLVKRQVFHEVPPRVEYSATKLGTSLNKALTPLAEWGTRYLKETRSARTSAPVTSVSSVARDSVK